MAPLRVSRGFWHYRSLSEIPKPAGPAPPSFLLCLLFDEIHSLPFGSIADTTDSRECGTNSMLASFEKLVGAAGDVRELEYVSALHQTDSTEVRKDASIKAEDIRLFLCSRYGIIVDDDQVQKTILSGLGGGSEGDNVLDLMEMVAILLIPVFLKASAKNNLEASGVLKKEDIDEEDEEVWVKDEKGPQVSQRTLPGDLVPTPPGLLDYVLKMILDDVSPILICCTPEEVMHFNLFFLNYFFQYRSQAIRAPKNCLPI